jgi:hypothetical protein
VHPLIETQKLTELQLLVCVGAGDTICAAVVSSMISCASLVFGYFMWGLMVLYVWNFISHKHEAAAKKNAPLS